MNLFFELHSGLWREAPGDDASTLKALALCGELPSRPRILDVGCGPGAQSLLLARATRGYVMAVDNHGAYLSELQKRAGAQGLWNHIETCRSDMRSLPFARESFDLIWSEGALYAMGWREALKTLSVLLKPGACLAATDLCWTRTPEPDARDFWQAGYPDMTDVAARVQQCSEAGYQVLGHFELPRSAWEDYYGPLERRLKDLARRHADNPDAQATLAAEQREIDLWRQQGDSFAYVFFVLRKPQPPDEEE
jgi:SAM-dependent methyltransferase